MITYITTITIRAILDKTAAFLIIKEKQTFLLTRISAVGI